LRKIDDRRIRHAEKTLTFALPREIDDEDDDDDDDDSDDDDDEEEYGAGLH
jgi:hypothetical protein